MTTQAFQVAQRAEMRRSEMYLLRICVMQRLIQGIHRFQNEDFLPLQGLFEQLAKGQNPETLFITCSDSRIDPSLLTRSKPGDLFILRNAGNIVPQHSAASGGEAATIEFTVVALGVRWSAPQKLVQM